MTCLIVDDEPHAAAAIQGMLEDVCPWVKVLGHVRSVPDAAIFIKEHDPQVVLLDVELPVYSGLDLFKFIPPDERRFQTIFITGYKDFALQAFEVQAVDYLLKPVSPARLQAALEKLRPTISPASGDPSLIGTAATARLAFRTKRGLQLVEVSEIMCFEAQGAYTKVYLANNQQLMLSKNLAVYEKMVDTAAFLRVHRSYLVQPGHIVEYRKTDGGTLVFAHGLEIPVGAEGRPLVQAWLNRLLTD